MADQIIDHSTACLVQADARRAWRVVGWVVQADPAHPGKFMARLLAGDPSPYVLLDETLPGLRAKLPPGLHRLGRQPDGIVEIWFAA